MGAVSKNPLLRQVIEQGKQTAEWLLTRFFSRLIPIFVLGFVARMYNMQILQQVFGEYALLLVWLLVLLAGYIVLLFAIGNGFSLSKLTRALKNLLPAGGIAFSSGCSISTMPWTIDGTSKNLHNPPFAKAIIPATTNIQQIGDCIINTFLCFIIYRHFYGQNPDFITWLQFSLIFVLARFATAAVIGGAIFIMLPIYENYLFFNAEMIAIILAFNVLLDPIVTSCNVVANGALCQIFEKVWIWIEKVSPSFIPQLAKKNDSESV
jgi:Na+/H+-dicarboxylate symporter